MNRARTDLLVGLLTTAAVLAAFGLIWALRAAFGFGEQNVVLAVVLTLTLTRVLPRGSHRPWLPVVEVPVLGVVAVGTGWLVFREPWVGQPLLVLALSLGILTRRWPGLVQQAGRLLALPFLALLVTPVPTAVPISLPEAARWSWLAGLVAVGCAGGANWAHRRWLAADPAGSSPPPRRPSRRRLDAPTRMAAQMAVGLGVALVVGHLLFGDRWAWTLLSAFLVASGNRGRGDVVHKAGLRVVGAGLGTLAVSLAVIDLPAGNRWLLVALFAVLAVAVVLRERSYAFWAAGVTAMIALLHGYYGDTGTDALRERVLGVIIGSAIGLAAAWFVLPVRTADVLRGRLADALAALTDDLAPDAAGPPALPAAVARLDEIRPALRAHRHLFARGHDSHAEHAIDAMHRLGEPPTDVDERQQLRRAVVRVRRAMVGRDDPAPDELPPELRVVHRVLAATRAPSQPATVSTASRSA